MENNADADFLWTEYRAIYGNGPVLGWSLGVDGFDGEEKPRPSISITGAMVHVRVKELLRVIQIDDMEGLRDALGARTCAIQWKDNEGADQTRVIFPELVIGVVAMPGSQLPSAIDTMRDVLQACLQGLSQSEGSSILDAIHEGFIVSNVAIIYELVRTVSQLKIAFKDCGNIDVSLHLHYTAERIGFMYRIYMIDIAKSRGPADLLRALDRQQHLDKATQSHIVEGLMRVIPNKLWSVQSGTIAQESIQWHYVCHSTRQGLNCHDDEADLVYISPYLQTFILNFKRLEPVSQDSIQAPYNLRLSGWSRDKDGCRVYYDAMDWWCFVSWPYVKRVISFGSNETLTRLIVFPPRLDVLKYIVAELSNPTSAPGIQHPATILPSYKHGEEFRDLVEEFELAPFMPSESQHLSSSTRLANVDTEMRNCLGKHFGQSLASAMLRTGVYPDARSFSYLVAQSFVTTTIIKEVDTALKKAMHDAGETASSLSEARMSYLLRCISQYREAFAMTRLLKHGLHLYTAASTLIHMLPQ